MEGDHRKNRIGKRSHRNDFVELMDRSLWDNGHPNGTKRPVGEEELLQVSAG